MRISKVYGDCMTPRSGPEGCQRFAAVGLSALAQMGPEVEQLLAVPDNIGGIDSSPAASVHDEEDNTMDVLGTAEAIRDSIANFDYLCEKCPLIALWRVVNNPPYRASKNTPD